jgi:hypothetical protein
MRSSCLPILSYCLEGVNLLKSLAASLEFVGRELCTKYSMFRTLPVQKLFCNLPISNETDPSELRFYHYLYCNDVCGDDNLWYVAHATKRRFIDELFWSYRVCVTGYMPSYYRALWSAFTDHIV